MERGYEKMTIREVAAVAGIGVSTFYDYAPNLRALAASTIHKRCMVAAANLQATVVAQKGQDIQTIVKALLQALVKEGFGRPKEWTALLLLERQVSSAAALRKIHETYVQVWADAIRLSQVNIPSAKITPRGSNGAFTQLWLVFTRLAVLHGRSAAQPLYRGDCQCD